MKKETRNAIKTVWKNKKEIFEGIKNSIFTTDTIEEIAKLRLSECSKCEHRDDEGESCTIKATAPCCKLCGCSLHLSTRSLSYVCKAGKWATNFTEVESLEVSMILNYKEKLDNLIFEKRIDAAEHKDMLAELTSNDKSISMAVRYKIRML